MGNLETSDGEITSLADTPLQATSLEEHVGAAAAAAVFDDEGEGYGDAADERAISRVLRQIRAQESSQGLAEEQLLERAENLYSLLCRQLLEGADASQASKIANLFDEKLPELLTRLR